MQQIKFTTVLPAYVFCFLINSSMHAGYLTSAQLFKSKSLSVANLNVSGNYKFVPPSSAVGIFKFNVDRL